MSHLIAEGYQLYFYRHVKNKVLYSPSNNGLFQLIILYFPLSNWRAERRITSRRNQGEISLSTFQYFLFNISDLSLLWCIYPCSLFLNKTAYFVTCSPLPCFHMQIRKHTALQVSIFFPTWPSCQLLHSSIHMYSFFSIYICAFKIIIYLPNIINAYLPHCRNV